MEGRKFELTLISACDLPDVRSLGRMKVYAEVSINGQSDTALRSAVDEEGETNPTWNVRFCYTLTESTIHQPGANVVVKLMCERTLGDRLVGEVKIPLKSLFERGVLEADDSIGYNVEGTADGVVYVRYSFGDKVLVPKDCGWKKVLVFLEGVEVLLEVAMFFLG